MFRHATIHLAASLCMSGLALADVSPGGVAIAPAPSEEKLSEDYDLTVGSQKTPVYSCRVSAIPFNQIWPGYQRPLDQTELASFAYWDMSGPVDVEVVSRRPVRCVAIRPVSLGIQAKVEGNRISFRMAAPRPIVVEVNGWRHALHLFADGPQAAPVDPQSPGVRYFGPGVHRPGKITLGSNQTLYIAAGAVVHGAVEVRGGVETSESSAAAFSTRASLEREQGRRLHSPDGLHERRRRRASSCEIPTFGVFQPFRLLRRKHRKRQVDRPVAIQRRRHRCVQQPEREHSQLFRSRL